MSRIAVYGATLDPITIGHTNIIRRAAQDYDHLIVAIGKNATKNPMFSAEDRRQMAEDSVGNIPNVRVDIIRNVYLVDYADQQGASYLVRGIRDEVDWKYERPFERFNRKRLPHIETRYIGAEEELAHVSSSFVRAVVGPEGWHEAVQEYVSTSVYNHFVQRRFMERWLKWWLAAGGTELKGHEVGQRLIAGYSESHRRYHVLPHPTKMLEAIDDYLELLSDPVGLGLASGGHDYVYNPTASDNEERSATALAAEMRADGIAEEIVNRTTRYIMVTKDHQPKTADEASIVDLDLLVLGQSARVYAKFAADIRDEYRVFSEAEFAAGRRRVLKSFLAQPNIFTTPVFYGRFEQAARANIQEELDQLAST